MTNQVVNQGVNQGAGILAGRVLGPLLSAGRGFVPVPDFYNAAAGGRGGLGAGFQNSQFMGMMHGDADAWKDYGLKGLGTGLGFLAGGPIGAMIGGKAVPWLADHIGDFGNTIRGWFGGGPTDSQRAEKFNNKVVVPQLEKTNKELAQGIWGQNTSSSSAVPGQFGGKGWEKQPFKGMAPGEMGVMGKGANGEVFIRGLTTFGPGYKAVYNKRKNNNG